MLATGESWRQSPPVLADLWLRTLAERIAADDADPTTHGQQYRFRGDNQRVQSLTDPAIILSGPADTGKTLAAPMKLGRDIDSISGASLSSRSTAYAVKKALALVDVVYRDEGLSPP